MPEGPGLGQDDYEISEKPKEYSLLDRLRMLGDCPEKDICAVHLADIMDAPTTA